MAHVSRLSKFAHVVLSTLLMFAFAPVALAVPANPDVNAAGEWTKPGPGYVQRETGEPGEDIYIIQHQAPPLALYQGDIPGLAPTAPDATGVVRLDTGSAASQAYLSYVAGLHANLETAIANRLGRPVDVVFRYDAALNGIAVRMTPDEALTVSSLAGIESVTRDFRRQLQTDNGPRWIGADEIWAETGPDGRPEGNAPCGGDCGEGIVAGVIDTGVNFDHPSFADIGGDGYDHSNPKGVFFGACDPVTGLPFCNDKLIGYYDFTGTGPEDDNGHGSHTASTTAGNVLDIELKAPTITINRSISGVAPHANIISYKGCSGLPVGCQLSALVGSINQATLDEVDVINYSIGGGSANPWTDLDAQAFFGAYSAGIFVATSASNDGPGFGTLGSPADAPWVTSVGASTHDRKLANGIVNMTNADNTAGPADIFGASLTAALPAARVVYAGDYGAALCGAGTGDPATGEGSGGNPFPAGTFNGEIVVCDRGEYGRVHKSENVFEAGAGGYVLANDEANGDSLVGDAYPLPGVHISYSDGLVLKAWIASNGGLNHQGTAEINGSNPSSAPENGDIMASFSSRGANPAVPSVIKPDVTAPGVDILAAWMTAVGTLPGGDPEFNVISGTSMSSPHTAGSGALILGANPTWTPDEVKSALMTTAFTAPPGNGAEVHPVYKEDGQTLADPFDMGAGRVDLHVAANAGFVLDETAANYNAANPLLAGDATTLNMPSLGNDDCGSSNIEETCTWTRTIRSTADTTVNWTIDITPPSGGVMTVSDGNSDITSFFLAPGEEKALTFTLDVTGSPKGDWMFGEVRFNSSIPQIVPNAHFPVAVIPKNFGDESRGVKLYFHGNNHDDSSECDYTGVGDADLPPCASFLSPDDQLDPDSPSAKWIPKSVNGSAAQTPYDPNWIWILEEETTLAGNMLIEWWASGAYPETLGAVGYDFDLFADGVLVQSWEDIDQNLPLGGQPRLLKALLPVDEVTATSNFVLKIEPRFVDTGQGSVIYYDSEESCNPAFASGPCDSRVTMPVVTGNLPPVANDDSVFMTTGSNVVVDVLANDFDPEGGPLSLEIITPPANGTADVTTGDTIVYQHDGSATLSDVLEYRVTDIDGASDTAFVNFTIADACFADTGSYSEDFELVPGETQSAGWSVETTANIPPAPVSNPWHLLSPELTAKSGDTVWHTDANGQDAEQAVDISKDTRLISPEMHVSQNTHLTFWHKFNTEDTFDGGVLEISSDGGDTWDDVVGAGGAFVTGGYNSSISVLASRPAWGGISNGFLNADPMQLVEVDLGALQGKTIQVRFRFVQDVLAPQPAGGWWIDDVAFSNLLEACPSQAPIANPDTDTVAANGSANTDVKANDTDPDTPHANLTVVSITTAPQHGNAVVMAPDHVIYTHTGGAGTTDFYEYRLEDPEGNFDTGRVDITITHAAPNAVDDQDTVAAGESVITDVKANDSDPDTPHADLFVSEIVTPPMHGDAVIAGTDSVQYTHDGQFDIADSYEYRVEDPQGGSDTAWVNIEIIQNRCPDGDDDSSDDDDFDNDCQRDDDDSDDDNDGQDDDWDHDDDNDGISDDDDSDDDNDGIDDEFDSQSTKESQTKSSNQAAANSDDTHSSNVAPGTLLLIALVETAPTDVATVEIRDPSGTVVATGVSVGGRALATTVPASSGAYTVRVLNSASAPMGYELTIIRRLNWP